MTRDLPLFSDIEDRYSAQVAPPQMQSVPNMRLHSAPLFLFWSK